MKIKQFFKKIFRHGSLEERYSRFIENRGEIGRCPFCGNIERNYTERLDWEDDVRYVVYCIECCAEGPVARTEENAIARWNLATR